MSLIQKKKSQYWWYDIKLPSTVVEKYSYPRSRYRGSTKTTDKRRALIIEAQTRLGLMTGTFQEPTHSTRKRSMTLSDCLWRCLDELWANHKSRDSFYRVLIQAIDTDKISSVAVTDLDAAQLNDWAQGLVIKNSRSTVNQKLGLISQGLKRARTVWGLELNIIDFGPLKLKKATNAHSVWFDDAAERRIHAYFASINRQDIIDLLTVLADVGSRFSKTVEIRTNQIDFEARTIRFTDTKNGDDLQLPLTARALAVFMKYKHKDVPFDNVTYNAVRCSWDRMRKQFGWPSGEGYKIHALRHTCGTKLGKAGVDIRVIQQWLGHRDIRQTARYTQVVSEQLEAARDKLEGDL